MSMKKGRGRCRGPAVFLTLIATLATVNVMPGAAIVRAQTAAMPVAAKASTVTIDNFSFTPETLTIRAGTRVTFINHDDIPHTVVAVDKSFRSKALDTDDSYEFTFTKSGDFDYFCGLHPHMKGRVIVTPE